MLKNSKNTALGPYTYKGACSFYLGAIVLVLVCQGAAGLLASAFADKNLAQSGEFNTAFMIFIQLANAAFIYLFTRRKRYKFDFEYIGKTSDKKGLCAAVLLPIPCAAVLMCAMYLPTVWYGLLTQVMGIPEDFGNIALDSAASVAMIIIASVLLAPVMEETIYRGILMHGLMREKGVVCSVLLAAASFMLMHMNPLQVCFQFALGVVGGFMAARSKRLIPSVLLHACCNVLALIIELTPLGGVLGGCVEWLMQSPGAATAITLGLFAAGGAILFFAIKFGFPTAEASEEAAQTEELTDDDKAVSDMKKARAEISRGDGTMLYWLAMGICIIMFIANFVTGVLS